jgi:hypothetical protein
VNQPSPVTPSRFLGGQAAGNDRESHRVLPEVCGPILGQRIGERANAVSPIGRSISNMRCAP